MRSHDDPIDQRTHAYWIPGPNGVALEAALVMLATENKAMTLTVRKAQANSGWMFFIDVQRE